MVIHWTYEISDTVQSLLAVHCRVSSYYDIRLSSLSTVKYRCEVASAMCGSDAEYHSLSE